MNRGSRSVFVPLFWIFPGVTALAADHWKNRVRRRPGISWRIPGWPPTPWAGPCRWRRKRACRARTALSDLLFPDPCAKQRPPAERHLQNHGPGSANPREAQLPALGAAGRYYWGEPLYGYYNSTDPWVLRRHANLLADAGIDTVIFDTTNRVTYRDVYMKLCEVWSQMRRKGRARRRSASW